MAKGSGGTRSGNPKAMYSSEKEYGAGRIIIDDGFPEDAKQAILAEFEKLEKEFGVELPRIHLANQNFLGLSLDEQKKIEAKIKELEKKQADAMTMATWNKYENQIFKLRAQMPSAMGVHHDNDFVTVGRNLYVNAGMIADHEFGHIFRYYDGKNLNAWKQQVEYMEKQKPHTYAPHEQKRQERIANLKEKIVLVEGERKKNPAHKQLEKLKKNYAPKVSNYASTSVTEFAAEVFAAYRKGDRRPFVVEAYKAVIKLPISSAVKRVKRVK